MAILTKVPLRVLLFCILLCLVFLQGSFGAGSAPPRVSVVVSSSYGELVAAEGHSFVLLYWEEPGNTVHQSVYQVFQPVINADGLQWDNLGYGSRVSDTESEYYGYYRYPAVVTADLAVANFQNYIYHVGSNPETGYAPVRAYPPSENYHMNYQKSTKTCQGCHSTHYAMHPMLLNDKIIYNICIECHGRTSALSKYNVLDGLVRIAPDTYALSPAGPFDSQYIDIPTTSYHNVFLESAFDDPNKILLYAPGSREVFSDEDKGVKLNLTCTDCHSAHVTYGSSDYRLLKYRSQRVMAYSYVSGNQYEVHYVDGMNSFCSNCHAYYNYGDGTEFSGFYQPHELRQDGGDGIKKSGEFYRHPTNINIVNWFDGYEMSLPLEHRNGGEYMTCKTCHFAHGSTIRDQDQISPELTMLGETKVGYQVGSDGKNEPVPIDRSSMLKRSGSINNKKANLCLVCHMQVIWTNTSGYNQLNQ
jgi:predicted CXXCH cytochrome family protein